MKKAFLTFLLSFILILPMPAWAVKPNDPHVSQWSFDDVMAYDAWDLTTGSKEVVVAVIDNGFDTFHPDLKDNVWKNKKEIPNNEKDDDRNGYIDDVYGWNFVDETNNPRPNPVGLTKRQVRNGVIHHGTLVAGLIGAVGDNSLDGVGINWRVKLMNLKVVGNGGTGVVDVMSNAVRYAVDNGADILNISAVGGSDDDLEEAIDYAYEKGVVIIAAAGNGNIALNYSPLYPVCSDAGEDIEKVLGVSAIDEDHRLATFSNNGSDCIDITAPGKNVSSTMRFSPRNGLDKRYGGGWSGTSFAAPLVSGAAALIKSIQPGWGAKEIYDSLLSTVHHTPGQDETLYATLFGHGLLQIDKAVEYALERVEEREVLSFLHFNKHTGEVNTMESNKEDFSLDYKIQLKGVGDAVGFIKDGETNFATVKRTSDAESRVQIFNKDFSQGNTWLVSSGGEMQIMVGDVFGDSENEVILANNYQTDQLFRVFSLSGEELAEYRISLAKGGASASLIKNETSGKNNILVLYKKEQSLWMEELSGEKLNLQRQTKIEDLQSRGSIGAGDIDGDGEDEYVVGNGAGEVPLVLIYESTGRLAKRFFAYETNYVGGFDFFVTDYDGDNQDDIITFQGSAGSQVKVWNNRPLKIAKWWPFEDSKEEVDFGVIPVIRIVK